MSKSRKARTRPPVAAAAVAVIEPDRSEPDPSEDLIDAGLLDAPELDLPDAPFEDPLDTAQAVARPRSEAELYPEAVDRVARKAPTLMSDAELAKGLALDPALLTRFLQKARMTGRWGQRVPSAAELLRRILYDQSQALNEPLLVKNPSTRFSF